MNVLLIIQDGIQDGIYISGETWLDFLLRLGVNIVSIFVLIRFIYYPNNSRVKYLFTFFLMGMMIFLIASILDQVELNMGIAFGLFAIFGIIRYRSPSIDLKEMTYLFLVIGVSMINALVVFNITDWFGLALANFIVLASAFFMEIYLPKNYVSKRTLIYSPTDFSVLNSNELLLEEIRQNTGIDVLRVEIEKENKTRNELTVLIYFNENNKDYTLSPHAAQEEQSEDNNGWESTSTGSYN